MGLFLPFLLKEHHEKGCYYYVSCQDDLKFFRMRYVAAYLLAAPGGNSSPSAADLEKILSSVGIEAEDDRIKKVISELNGKDIETLIAEGSKKLASVPAGGAPAAGGAAPAAGGGAGEAPAAEAKKEEPEEESGSDDDMGFGLFD